MIANVPHVGCSQQRIADGMYQHVGITVAQQTLAVFQFDASYPKITIFNQLMNVVAEANSYFHIVLYL
jgi:hypothetical protein